MKYLPLTKEEEAIGKATKSLTSSLRPKQPAFSAWDKKSPLAVTQQLFAAKKNHNGFTQSIY